MTVGVRPIPADREASTASNYTAGTADGTRPAWFNMNTYRPQEQFKYTIEALVLHESVPGHHLQTRAWARSCPELPEFRRVFAAPAFSEGWALYAESLGRELGGLSRPTTQVRTARQRAVPRRPARRRHRHPRHGLVARSGARVLRAARARRSRSPRSIATSRCPGQALAYKLGQLKIQELRRAAEQELGPRFDVRDFHDVVLRNSTLPLDLLEEQVNRVHRHDEMTTRRLRASRLYGDAC